MYTYHHVISRLTEADKIRLLTDLHSLGTPEAEDLGIPRVSCALLREGLCGETSAELPSPALLARSWNSDLMTEAAAEATRALAKRGVNHVILPPAGSAIRSDGDRLSEDPHLSGLLSGALLAGVNQGGLTATASGYGFTPADRRGMDTPATPRFTAEHMVAPYAALTRRGQLLGLILENSDPAPEAFPADTYFLFRRRAGERETVTALARGELLVQGSPQALRAALHTYRRLKAAISHGKATMGELETAVHEGEAMAEETLDTALDRLLAFANACGEGMTATVSEETVEDAAFVDESTTDGAKNANSDDDSTTSNEISPDIDTESPTEPAEVSPIEPPFDTATDQRPAPPPDSLRQRALDGATVLLENRDKLLPLTKPARICILGDIAREGQDVLPLANALTAHGHTYLGFARGYDPALDRGDRLTTEALTLATGADVILLFVGGPKGSSRLPAAQLALLDGVGHLGKKTVVILSSEIAPDMGFLRTMIIPVAGLLLTPLSVKGAALHAVETLLGDRAPLGRLTETLTDHADPTADRRGYKVGPFVGYRYYDTVGLGAVYPFGHGLSYTKFRYSALKIDPNGAVTFTVQNMGKRAGVAIPQVYLGIKGSAVLRPQKELMGFAYVSLQPKEKRTVTLSFGDPLYLSAGIREKGRYRLSVGESVTDIRLTADLSAGEGTLPPDGAKLHEYLPTVTNIRTERYVLEAEHTPMKPSLRNLLFGIAAIVLAVSVKIYDIVSVSTSVFLNIVAGLLAVGAVFFFVLELTDRKKQFARERAALEEANAALFAEADDISVPSADALFELTSEASDEEDGGQTKTSADEFDHFLDVDRELTFPVAAAAISALAAEKGMGISCATARSLLAAMAASRLLVLKGVGEERFAALTALLSEYFGSPHAVDRVDDSYTDEAALLYGQNEAGETIPRGALEIIESARRDPRSIHLVSLSDVTFAGISDYFVPYARYARAPHTACSITAHDTEGSEVAYLLPENLWFVLDLREGEGLHLRPDYMAEVASVLTPVWETVEPTPTHAEFAPFRYGQMLYLCDRMKSSFALEEDTWKRIDRLEAYAARFGGFTLTNKLWLGLEAYLAVLLTGEIDPATALDEALAVRLLPALIPALSGKIPAEERSFTESLDAILGDGNTPICRRTVKESGADLT